MKQANIKKYKINQLNEEVRSIQQKLRDLNHFVITNNNNDPIVLDVGGKEIVVDRKTLTSVEGSMLSAHFSGNIPLKKTNENKVFIDRDPDVFTHMINYLRSGR